MPRRDIESRTTPIGSRTKLVETMLSPYQQEGPAGRIGVQWQTGAILGALPSMTGTSALLKAARDVDALARQHANAFEHAI
ncbi:hypothetical protein HBI79_174010 [Parastagonospora nodorum]|nr:hypothetical protein HBI79_174010 [Parastagonospora nodorum]KAH5550099.1 hypothetical protein HBI27_016430 [Parastagonospora nodorum]KAH5683333.1 hypothetical protein HBI21_038460 [Parastagonospora nodorum]